jgi:hypothetical protein
MQKTKSGAEDQDKGGDFSAASLEADQPTRTWMGSSFSQNQDHNAIGGIAAYGCCQVALCRQASHASRWH